MYARLSFAATVSGVILQLAGLAVSLALDAQNADLGAREGLLALSDPGDLLFFFGLVLTVLGVGTMVLALLLRGAGSVVLTTPGSDRNSRMSVVSILVLFAIAALALFVVVFAPADTAFSGQAQSTDAHEESHDSSSQHPDEINITWERLREIDGMLATAKAATQEYQDVERARADGYRQVMGALRETGAHFVNQEHVDDGGFDVARPELYCTTAPKTEASSW